MPFRLQQRRDTAANWTSNNPTLAAGEIGIETNTSRFKIGDGTTAWTSLVYTSSQLGYTTTATAAGTTTLTVSSNSQQLFTGTSTQTVVMPVASTMVLGTRFLIENNSTGNLTVNSSGSNLIATVYPGTSIKIISILTSGTDATSWDFEYVGFNAVTGTGNAVLSASPTLTGTVTASGDINLSATNGPGSVTDQLNLLLMGAY
jgi:Major tropism determinant N-terminal domain